MRGYNEREMIEAMGWRGRVDDRVERGSEIVVYNWVARLTNDISRSNIKGSGSIWALRIWGLSSYYFAINLPSLAHINAWMTSTDNTR